MISKRELLKNKYEEVLKQVKTLNLDNDIFPDLEHIDFAEILILFEYCFPDNKTYDNLKRLLLMKGLQILDSDINKLVLIIDDALLFIAKLK